MKQLASFAAVALLAVTGSADQRQIQVAGIVRSAKSGEALKNAVIMLTSEGAEKKVSRATTAADGSFGFSGLPPGQYQLTIRKPGYQVLQRSAPVTVFRDSAETARLTLSLWPHGAIAGRVVDWEGEPVAEAEVRAYAVVYQMTGATLSLAAKADGNDAGEYRLFDLPAGKYVLQVAPPRAATPSGQFYADTPAMYYPGAASPAQALPIELNWGEDATHVDVTISRGQSYAIAGAVWDAAAEGSCTRCVVQVVQHDGPYRVSLPQTARVSRDGTFVLRGLASGDYNLVVRQGSSDGAVAQAQAVIRNRHVEDARLIVGLQQPVTGRIVLDNPPEGIDATGWMPQLWPVAVPEWWPRGDGQVLADRQFAIQGVAPARYRFEISGLPGAAYLKTLRAGGQALASPEILVPQEGGVSGLEAVIAFDGAIVQGKVASPGNAQLVHARVFLVPRQGQGGYQVAKTAETAPDGSFSLGSVVPGSYTLYALPAATSQQIFDPAVQAAMGQYAKPVNLDPKATVNLEIAVAAPLP